MSNKQNTTQKTTASQIGWTLDVSESASKTMTRTGRVSRLPVHLRGEVYGGPPCIVEQEEEDEVVTRDLSRSSRYSGSSTTGPPTPTPTPRRSPGSSSGGTPRSPTRTQAASSTFACSRKGCSFEKDAFGCKSKTKKLCAGCKTVSPAKFCSQNCLNQTCTFVNQEEEDD